MIQIKPEVRPIETVTPERREKFSPTEAMPDCTHRVIVAYVAADTNAPLAFWACRDCGRRFEPSR